MVLFSGIAMAMLMYWNYEQQVDVAAVSFEQKAEERINEISALIVRELELVDRHLATISENIERNVDGDVDTPLEFTLEQAVNDVAIKHTVNEFRKEVPLQQIFIVQRGENDKSYSLLTNKSEVSNVMEVPDVMHIQKHYEWITENPVKLADSSTPVIISSSISERINHHIYYSALLLANVKDEAPVMVTAILDVELLQQYLPNDFYLKLDGVVYSTEKRINGFELKRNESSHEFYKVLDTLDGRKLWGEWVVGAISGTGGSINEPIFEITVVIALTLISILALEAGRWSRRSLVEKNIILEERIARSMEEVNTARENGRVISYDLLDSELRLNSIIDVATDGVVICDRSGAIKNINRIVKELFGYRKGELVGKKIDFLFPKLLDQEKNGEKFLAQVEANSSPMLIECKGISKDHIFIAVELYVTRIKAGRHEAWSILIRDISERVKDKGEIRDAQENLRAVIENVAEGIITSDSDGEILSFNPAAEKIFGWNSGEVIGKNVSVLMTGEDREYHVRYLKRYIEAGKSSILGAGPREVVGVRKDGDAFHMEIATSEMLIGKKRVFIAIVRDITERKIIEKNMHMSYSELESLVESHTDDLKTMNKKLVKARDDALVAARSKAEFLAMMSHEIRTPINGVLGMLGLMRDSELNDEQRDYIETAYSSGEVLLELLNDVLDLSKIDAGCMELDNSDFDIYQVVEKSAYLISTTLHDRDIEVDCYISSDVPRCVIGDAGRLRQVLTNLVSNSVKFTREGSISVSLSLESSSNDGYILRFDVTDTGIGIEEIDAEKIFEEFSQADNSVRRNYGGTGLGLTICKRFVNLMGGEISVESELGVGTSFSFSASFGVSAKQISPLRLKGCSILLLSDTDARCNLLQRQIEEWDCEVKIIDVDSTLKDLETLGLENHGVAVLDIDAKRRENYLEFTNGLIERLAKSGVGIILVHDWAQSFQLKGLHDEYARVVAIARPVLPTELYNRLSTLIQGATEDDRKAVLNQLIQSNEERNYKGVRILVAEDNIVNQKVVTSMLANIDVCVDLASNGQEALEMLANDNHTYHLVLMDCQMPVVDGYAATRKIRSLEKLNGETKRIPVIAMTAHALPGDREKCLDAGMDEYITKPINIEIVRKVIERWV